MPAEPVERLYEGNEVARNEAGALVDQLIEGVLAVGSGLTPVDRTGLAVHGRAGERHVLAVALHRQLLEIGREALQILVVGQHRDGLGAEEVVVPDAKKSQERWQIARE